MKILVTGGNRGLGNAIVETLKADSISRSTSNHDITKNIDTIIEKSLDYDIFINNAFDGPPQEDWANFGQSVLLMKMFQSWKAHNKKGWLFNIGSIASDDNVAPEPSWETYRVSKKSLEAASLQCSRAFRNNQVSFKTTLIKPDRLDTELSRSKPTWTGNGVDCNDIITFIKYCLEIKSNSQIDQVTISLNYDYK